MLQRAVKQHTCKRPVPRGQLAFFQHSVQNQVGISVFLLAHQRTNSRIACLVHAFLSPPKRKFVSGRPLSFLHGRRQNFACPACFIVFLVLRTRKKALSARRSGAAPLERSSYGPLTPPAFRPLSGGRRPRRCLPWAFCLPAPPGTAPAHSRRTVQPTVWCSAPFRGPLLRRDAPGCPAP